ncbi:MAG: hypothetical protein M3R27_02655 [Bacteroidota bacterium]|nr:hypothetical protein [Bacteroidota bacterium]
MIKNLSLIFVCGLIAGCDPNDKCGKFREGEFSYKEAPFSNIKITRTKTEQTEHETKTGLKVRYDIKWTSDCEYELIQTWSNDSAFSLNNGSMIKTKIKNIEGDMYDYDASSAGMNTSNTIVKLK